MNNGMNRLRTIEGVSSSARNLALKMPQPFNVYAGELQHLTSRIRNRAMRWDAHAPLRINRLQYMSIESILSNTFFRLYGIQSGSKHL